MALDNRLDLVNTANRRGLLLGLTLSEIMMIILFALLLLFGVIFLEQEEDRKRIDDLNHRVQDGETALAALKPAQEILSSLGLNKLDDVVREMKAAQRLREQIADLNQQVSALAAMTDPEDKKKLSSVQDDLKRKEAELVQAERKIDDLQRELKAQAKKQQDAAQIASAMAEAGMTPQQVKDAEKSLAAIKGVVDDLRARMEKAGVSPTAAQQAIDRASKDWVETAMDNKNVSEQANYWKTKYETEIGNGKKFMSPCWATNGNVDPIYDASLTDDGIVVRRFEVPQWAEDYERLPTKDIKLMELMKQADFVSATRPLFNYSNKKDCRFFVRIFDDTSVNAKLTYQARRRAVEGHFYIIDMKDAKFSSSAASGQNSDASGTPKRVPNAVAN